LNVAQAREEAINFKADINKGEFPDVRKPNTLTFGALVEDHYAPYVTAHKKTGIESLIMLRVQFERFYSRTVASLTVADFEKWRSSRMLEKVKAASLNRYRAAVMSMLNWAVGVELIESNPITRFKPLKETDSEPIVRYLWDDERARIFAALEEREKHLFTLSPRTRGNAFADHFKPIVILALNTAIRRGSLLSLTWGDIDLNDRIITVRAANAKNSKTQRVRMNQVTFETLKAWRVQSADTSKDAYVFPSPRTGKPMHDCRSAWDNLMKAANVDNFRWHDMRHDAATRLRRKKTPLDVVQQTLGHASVKTTQRYARVGEDEISAAMELLDEDLHHVVKPNLD
jgi:integrase